MSETTGSGQADAGAPRGIGYPVALLERVQDLISIVVGVTLVLLAAYELVAGVVSFFASVPGTSAEAAGVGLLDRMLLVLILIEIVHTVVLSLREHHLVAQPFIIVGLVAAIRKVLVVLSGAGSVPTAQIALLIAMVVVFVAALLAVSRFGGSDFGGSEGISAAE